MVTHRSEWRQVFGTCRFPTYWAEPNDVASKPASSAPLGAVSNFVTRVTTGVRDRRADLEVNVRGSLARIKEIAEG